MSHVRNMDVSELTRLLEYVPKETAFDLHKKILGQLIAKRHFQEVYRTGSRADRAVREQEFIDSLSDQEIFAWEEFTESVVLSMDECRG